MTNTGAVGIGTNNPQQYYKCHVAGALFVDSDFPDLGRSVWTKVHSRYGCAYNLWSTYYNKDVFYACGEGWIWSMKGGFFGSDFILKESIMPIESPLERVKRLNGIRFRYIDGKEKDGERTKNTDDKSGNDEDFRLGFIAQEVEAIFPETVRTMPDGTKAIAYMDLIAALAEAIKEQQTQIETLQTQLYSQEQDMVELKKQLSDRAPSNKKTTKNKKVR